MQEIDLKKKIFKKTNKFVLNKRKDRKKSWLSTRRQCKK